jgi:hypothetical protein
MQCVSVVIESVSGDIGRKNGRRVDLDGKQVAHRIGIFASVQALERRSARIDVLGRRTIEL